MAFTLNLSNYMTSSSNTQPVTHAHTTTTGTNILIVCVIGIDNSTELASEPTYNGQAMTPVYTNLGGSGFEAALGIWYLLNPPIGAYSISYPNAAANNIRMYATSWKTQSGYTPAFEDSDYIEHTPSGTPPIAVPGLTATGAWCGMAAMRHGGKDAYSTVSHTLMYWYDEGSCNSVAQYGSGTSSGTVNFTFTPGTSDDDCAAGIIFKEVAAASATVNAVPITCSATKILSPSVYGVVYAPIPILTAQHSKILSPALITESVISIPILTAQHAKILDLTAGSETLIESSVLTAQQTILLSPNYSQGHTVVPLTAQNTQILFPEIQIPASPDAQVNAEVLTCSTTTLLAPDIYSIVLIEIPILTCSSTILLSPESYSITEILAEILTCSSAQLLAPEISIDALTQINAVPLTCSHTKIIDPSVDTGIQYISGFYTYQLGNSIIVGITVS